MVAPFRLAPVVRARIPGHASSRVVVENSQQAPTPGAFACPWDAVARGLKQSCETFRNKKSPLTSIALSTSPTDTAFRDRVYQQTALSVISIRAARKVRPDATDAPVPDARPIVPPNEPREAGRGRERRFVSQRHGFLDQTFPQAGLARRSGDRGGEYRTTVLQRPGAGVSSGSATGWGRASGRELGLGRSSPGMRRAVGPTAGTCGREPVFTCARSLAIRRRPTARGSRTRGSMPLSSVRRGVPLGRIGHSRLPAVRFSGSE